VGGDFFGQGSEGILRRRRRLFDQGELKLVILQAISEKPRYGYEIIKGLEERLNGTYSPSPGVVYPTLTLLEELGYASASSREDGKKVHAITPEGLAFLQANREVLDATFQRLTQTVTEQPPPQIIRAVENLKLAVKLRLRQGPLSSEEIQRIAAVFDKAALEIEQN